MSPHNIQFHDKIKKNTKILVFLSYRKNFVGLKNEFEIAVVNEPSVFELLRFDCIILFRPCSVASDPGLTICPRPACPNIQVYYGNLLYASI